MKKIKFGKSEYAIIINLIASLFSLLVFLAGDYYYTDGDNSFLYSYMILFYSSIATIWFSVFVPLNREVFEKRWLTKKEKNISYLVYAAVNVLSFAVKIATVQEEYKQDIKLSLVPFAIISVLWFILKAYGPCSKEYELNGVPERFCPDPFIFESEKATLLTFGVGSFWYSDRKYKRLCKIYIKTAKEFSGKASVREIEFIVRNRVMMDGSRLSSFSTITALVLMGAFFLLQPFCDMSFAFVIASIFQVVGIFTLARKVHDPYTPNEAEELAKKKTEKNKTVKNVSKPSATAPNKYSFAKEKVLTDGILDVVFSESEKTFLSMCDVRKYVQKRAGRGNKFWLIMSVGFSAPVIPTLILSFITDIEWFWVVIFGGVYGVIGAVFTFVFIKEEKARRKIIKSVRNEIRLSLITCTGLRFNIGDGDGDHLHILFSDYGNYIINQDAYHRIYKGDRLAFAKIEDYCIAFPLKCWEIEGFSHLQ